MGIDSSDSMTEWYTIHLTPDACAACQATVVNPDPIVGDSQPIEIRAGRDIYCMLVQVVHFGGMAWKAGHHVISHT